MACSVGWFYFHVSLCRGVALSDPSEGVDSAENGCQVWRLRPMRPRFAATSLPCLIAIAVVQCVAVFEIRWLSVEFGALIGG